MGIVEEARAARDAGSAWRARDLLAEHVERERDPEALALLGEVLHEMGDLPRAGAIWFAAGASGPDVDAAVAAWREQSRDDFAVMWESLPASVQAEPRARRVEALRVRAIAAGADGDASEGPAGGGRVAAPAEGDDDGDHGVVLGGLDEQEPGEHGPGEHGPGEQKPGDEGRDAAWLVAWVLAAVFVVFAVIGFITTLNWLVPD